MNIEKINNQISNPKELNKIPVVGVVFLTNLSF